MSLSDYDRQEVLGEGTFGKVYRGVHKPTGRVVAMKLIKLNGDDEGVPSTALREIALLRDLQHQKNIVELIDVLNDGPGSFYLIFEYVEQDLKKYMDRVEGPLPMALVKSYMYQLLRGVEVCHSRGIMHRDLKPQNVLVDRRGVLKIADFGLARAFSVPLRKYTHEVVTLWYRAPEILLGQAVYAPPVDIWSVGAMFVELITKKALWRGDSEIDELYKIFRTLGTPTTEVWPDVTSLRDYNDMFPMWPAKDLATLVPTLDRDGVDLLEKMLVYDPSKRISAKKALMHPWFRDLDKTAL